MKLLVRAYFDEAKWFHQNYIPTMEEYMNLALRTSGYSMLTTMSFLGMGDIVTKEAFDWSFRNPKIITASSVICRLVDDMRSHKVYNQKNLTILPISLRCDKYMFHIDKFMFTFWKNMYVV